MNIIYAPQLPIRPVDLSRIYEYGNKLNYLLEPHQNQAIQDMARTIKIIDAKLEHFSDNDWLLPIGSPELIGIMFHFALLHNDGFVSVLKWDKQVKRYYPLYIDTRK